MIKRLLIANNDINEIETIIDSLLIKGNISINDSFVIYIDDKEYYKQLIDIAKKKCSSDIISFIGENEHHSIMVFHNKTIIDIFYIDEDSSINRKDHKYSVIYIKFINKDIDIINELDLLKEDGILTLIDKDKERYKEYEKIII